MSSLLSNTELSAGNHERWHGLEVVEHRFCDGVEISTVHTSDGYEGKEFHAERFIVQDVIDGLERGLGSRATHDTTVERGRAFLEQGVTLPAWKKSMPSALALYPLHYPDMQNLVTGEEIDEHGRELFRHSLDGISIRNRSEIFRKIIHGKKDIERIASIACGAAVPVFEALKEYPHHVSVTMLDNDPRALALAEQVAEHNGYDDVTTVEADLMRTIIFGSGRHEALPEKKFSVVDILGIVDYLDDRVASRLISRVAKLVEPGGMLVFGNMLTSHPNLRFNQEIVGWPSVKPRSYEQLISIVRQAGIDPGEHLRFIESTDKVYGIGVITDPGANPVRETGHEPSELVAA